jgi:adenylate kinase family enzyme
VPDEFMVILAKQRIAEDDCVRKGYIFDGFPRTPAQVEMLNEADILLDKVNEYPRSLYWSVLEGDTLQG